jgi:AcrR family transcriptional regulator
MNNETENTREQILEAAGERFRRYGYVKTTMSEIAADCKMSAANLYRFFENKQDIGAALVSRSFAEEVVELRDVVRRPDISASIRIKDFALALLEHNYARAADQPKVGELVEMICTQRRDVYETHARAKRSLLAELLATGNGSGEFDVADCDETAAAISAALTLFDVRVLIFMKGPREELRRKAEAIIELLLNGLKTR